MRRIFATVGFTGGLIFAAAVAAGDLSDESLAASAQQWLALVDAGRYEQAWNTTAGTLRDGTDRARWAQRVRSERRNDGAAACRKAIAVERLADTSRVSAVFVTEFADGRRIGEKVTLSADGTQVVAYRIGPPATDRGAPCATATTPEPQP